MQPLWGFTAAISLSSKNKEIKYLYKAYPPPDSYLP